MSAPSCLVYYGIRYELSLLEVDNIYTDVRVLAARRGGIKSYFGNFDLPGERYLLFVGAQLGVLGPENRLELQLSDAELESLFVETRSKLIAAGFETPAQLYVAWEADDE